MDSGVPGFRDSMESGISDSRGSGIPGFHGIGDLGFHGFQEIHSFDPIDRRSTEYISPLLLHAMHEGESREDTQCARDARGTLAAVHTVCIPGAQRITPRGLAHSDMLRNGVRVSTPYWYPFQ